MLSLCVNFNASDASLKRKMRALAGAVWITFFFTPKPHLEEYISKWLWNSFCTLKERVKKAIKGLLNRSKCTYKRGLFFPRLQCPFKRRYITLAVYLFIKHLGIMNKKTFSLSGFHALRPNLSISICRFKNTQERTEIHWSHSMTYNDKARWAFVCMEKQGSWQFTTDNFRT